MKWSFWLGNGNTRSFENDCSYAGFFCHAFNTRNRSFQFQRIDGLDFGDTNSSQYLFNIDFLDNFSHDGPSGARVWLVAGHGSCRVVENNEYHICLIVDCIYYAGDRGGEKCRIAHECKAGGIGFYFFYALCNIESGAHAQTSIDHVKRHGISKCITADVTAENRFLTFHGSFDCVERSPVRTAGTQNRRTYRQSRRLWKFLCF